MNRTINIVISLVVVVFALQIVQAQGTIYLSNLGQPSTGSLVIGSDQWLAMPFFTGTNTGGYLLDSVQLAMTDATGNPSGFTVMVYNESGYSPSIPAPGSSIGALDGSANPATAGIYTYTSDSSLELSGDTRYFIVLSSGTTVANGAYETSECDSSGTSPGSWGEDPYCYKSNPADFWLQSSGIAQFAITATSVPEPSPSWLFLLGGGIFSFFRGCRRQFGLRKFYSHSFRKSIK